MAPIRLNQIVPYILMATYVVQSTFGVQAILNPVDFLALQAIKNSLKDMPGSSFFSSWDFTSDPCNFPGVSCDSNKVIALNLGDPKAGSPGLTGRLNPAIGNLSALIEFSIVPGQVFGSLPESLSKLKNLRFLSLTRNFVYGGIPASLGQLRELRTLDLSYNQLTGEIPSSIGNITTLSNVILCHNRLNGLVPSFLSQSLTRLNLKHNNLSGSIQQDWLPPSLQYLSLSWNRLSGSAVFLNQLDQLNYLDLSLNQFTGTIPIKVFKLRLTNLQLQRNQFSGSVKPTSQVTIPTVDLSHNMLSGTISPMFSGVKTLYLNNNRFTGRVPSKLVDQLLSASISTLYLQQNYLTGIKINPTAEIPPSSSLCLHYNCMVPPLETACPLMAGKLRTRPASECRKTKG